MPFMPWMRQKGDGAQYGQLPPARLFPDGGAHADADLELDALGSQSFYAYLDRVRVGDGSLPRPKRDRGVPEQSAPLGSEAEVFPLEDTQEYYGQAPTAIVTLPTPLPEGNWPAPGTTMGFMSIHNQPSVPDLPGYLMTIQGYLTAPEEKA